MYLFYAHIYMLSLGAQAITNDDGLSFRDNEDLTGKQWGRKKRIYAKYLFRSSMNPVRVYGVFSSNRINTNEQF